MSYYFHIEIQKRRHVTDISWASFVARLAKCFQWCPWKPAAVKVFWPIPDSPNFSQLSQWLFPMHLEFRNPETRLSAAFPSHFLLGSLLTIVKIQSGLRFLCKLSLQLPKSWKISPRVRVFWLVKVFFSVFVKWRLAGYSHLQSFEFSYRVSNIYVIHHMF